MQRKNLRDYVIRRIYDFSRGCTRVVLVCLVAEIILVALLLQGYYIDVGVWIYPRGQRPAMRMRSEWPNGTLQLAINAPNSADSSKLELAKRSSETDVKNAKELTVAIGCAVTSFGAAPLTSGSEIRNNLPFFSILLPSFCNTASKLYNYHFYLAFDTNDTFFIRRDSQKMFANVFRSMVNATCPDPGRVDLHFVRCGHALRPAWAQNDAMMEAYLDNRDYFYRINDDTVMESPGWTETFVYRLQTAQPRNVGVVGPNHKGGNDWILTYDFVHRTHVEVFGFYYPRVFTDWYADGWITNVYLPGHTTKVIDVLLTHQTVLGQRYQEDKGKLPMKNIMISKGKAVLDSYLRALNRTQTLGVPRFPAARVVVMALHGTDDTYTLGAIRNANLVRVFLPGWRLRVYVERVDEGGGTGSTLPGVPERILAKLRQLGAEIVYVDRHLAAKIPAPMWRYLVTDDDSVQYFIIRDPNMRLTERDATVVNEFVSSDRAFHAIRDHPSHAPYPVLDGLWGGKVRRLRGMLDGSMRDQLVDFVQTDLPRLALDLSKPTLFHSLTLNKAAKNFVVNALWPLVREQALSHDSVSCDNWEKTTKFPVKRRNGEYLGQTYSSFGLLTPGNKYEHDKGECTQVRSRLRPP